MAEKRVSVRLAAVGGKQVRAELTGIGEAGTKSFGRLSREAQKVNDRLAGFAREVKSAETSADVFGKEMDRLRAKYDPLFRKSKQYEAELEELNRAQQVGALSTQQYDAALVRLNAQYQQSAVAVARMGQASRSALFQTQGMGGGIQNVAYQVGDFAVQVGAGTSAARALGLQLPQLLGGFGVVGAVAGAAVAVMVPLIGAFVSGGDEAKSFADTLKDLEGALGDYQSAVKDSFVTTDDMIAKYGDLSDAMKRVKDAMVGIKRSDELDKLNDTAKKIATSLGGLDKKYFLGISDAKVFADNNFMAKYGKNGTLKVSETFQKLIRDFDVSAESALKLTNAMRRLAAAEGPEEFLDAAQDLDNKLQDVFGAADKIPKPIKEMKDELVEAEKAAGELYSTMIDGEARLAASRLAQSAQTDLKTSEINWQFRDDPIEKAKALAGLKYDQAVKRYNDHKDLLDDETLKILKQTREEFVATAGAIANNTQRLREWEKSQRDAGKSTASATKNMLKFMESFDRQDVAIKHQIELLGKTGPQIAALQAKWKLLDAAKQDGIDLNGRLAGSMMTVREAIDAEAQSLGAETAQLELFTRNRALVEGFGQSLVSGLSKARDFDDVLGSLGKSLENIGQKLIEAALNMAIFGNAAGSLQGGSGLLGSLLSAVFGDSFSSIFGGMADGGAVHAATGGRIDASGGGRLSGPGGPRGDKIAAWLSAGEYVVNAVSAKKYAPLLEAINSDAFDIAREMANGGSVHNAPVSPPPIQTLRTIRSRASVTNTVNIGDINISVPEGTDPKDAAAIGREVRKQLDAAIDQRLQNHLRPRGMLSGKPY